MKSLTRRLNKSFLLVLLGLVALFCLTSSVFASDCTSEQLPRSFDGPAYLGDDSHFHISGKYQLNFTNGVQNVSFWIDNPSFGRFTVVQADLRLRITLYSLGPERLVSSSWASPEATVYAPLSTGQWRISFTPTEALLPCHTVIFEADVTPVADLLQNQNSYTCPNGATSDNLPDSNAIFSGASVGSDGYTVTYDTLNDPAHQPSWFALRNPTPQEHGIRIARSWNFEVKKPVGKSGLFSFKARLGYDFLTSGSLGILLAPANVTNLSFNCSSCNWGTKLVQNHNVIEDLLSPGQYTLWLFDLVDQKNTTISNCSPYQLRVELIPLNSAENPLSCTAPRVPKSLNDPGYISEEGYLQYSENPYIDIAGGKDMEIPFNVTKPSFFRAYLYNPRADLDLELFNATGDRIASSFRVLTFPDVIIYQLLPGTYKLVVGLFGAWPDSFCDTFLLQIGIIPADSYDDSYCPSTVSAPDFTGFQQAIKDAPFAWSLNSPDSPYYYLYNGSDYSQHTIFVQNFTTDDYLAVHAMLGFNFVLNDMTAWIVDWENKVPYFARPVHDYGVVHLLATIPPGTYGLVVATGPIQYTRTSTAWFPSCLEYTMSFSVKALQDKPRCWDVPSLPASLNVPQYLGHIDRVHLVGDFLLPTFTFTSEQSIYFTVGKPSEFRAFTAPGVVDSDFILYEDNVDVNRSVNVRGSDQIVYVLSVGKSYRLKIRYYNWGSKTLPPCSTFELELAIAPLPSQWWVTCDTSSPDGKVINVAADDSTEKHTVYSFNQGDRPFSARLQIVSSVPFEFRALATYPFLRGDLSLSLYNNATGQSVARGFSGNNWENVGPLPLGAGTYDLILSEPARLPAEVRRCIQFALSIWAAPANLGSDDDSLLVQCGIIDLPSSFNSAGYLSPISGYSMNFVNEFLVNTAGHQSSVSFSLDRTSVFRAYLPALQVVDVDIRLRSGGADGAIIASSLGLYTAEQILVELPGNQDYTLTVNYYSFNSPYPTQKDCASFPIEVAVEPVDQVNNNPVFAAPCTDSNVIFPPTLDLQPYPAQGTLVHRSTNTNQTFHYHITFSVENYAQFFFNLQYDFVASGLTLRLEGEVEGSATEGSMVWPAQIGVNHAWLNLNLGAGNYTVHVTNGTGFSAVKPLPYIQCQYWSWYYSLNFTDELPDDECSDFDSLPSDLYSLTGGSQGFGGPQDPATGDVVISGQFYVPNAQSRTRFTLPQKGYLRALSIQPATFTVIQDAQGSQPLTPLPDGFYSLSPGAYYLGVTMTNAATNPCPTLDLVIVIESNDTVTSELMCPIQLPSPQTPPNNITVNPSTSIYSDNYVFTSARMANRTGRLYTYNITLNLKQPLGINARIDFDVLVTGFSLALFDTSNDQQIASGTYGSIETQTDQVFNYECALQTLLPPGTYVLQITDNVKPGFSKFVTFCHQFAFSLTAIRSSGTPILLQVSPPGATKLNPRRDLSIQLIFSERVYRPMRANIQGVIQSQQLVYLQNVRNATDKLIPSFARLIPESYSILRVVFNHSSFSQNGADYQLYVKVSSFIANNSTMFTDPNGAADNVVFSFSGCNCNGKGSCNITSGTCVCNPGYTGPNCLSCADGYHAAADICVQNAVCDDNTCNSHGKCYQNPGSVYCICSTGYGNSATGFCNTCAPGYSGYPNCKVDSDDEEPRCNLPLLPNSLDQPAYLGTTGRIHLQGYYYIDLYHRHHETTFTLTTDSLVRIFTPPHIVDIDITLYSLNTQTGVLTRVVSSLSFNDAESIYVTLSANAPQQQYQIQFRYFVWGGVKVADCQSFNLDLEIVPKTVAQSEISAYNSGKCPQTNLLPLQEPDYQSPFAIPMDKGLTYHPTTTFAVLASGQQSWMLRWDFTISNIPAGNVVTFQAALEERFLTGAFALVLEYGNNHSHCGIGSTTRQSRSSCVVGRDVMNGHILATQLGPGSYTLWLYQPSAQDPNVASCALFTFKLDISLSQADEDVFNCPYAEIPTSLDWNLYHKKPAAPGRLHLADEYLLHDEGDVMAINLNLKSQLRLAIYSDNVVLITLTQANGSLITGAITMYDKATISAILTPGNYSITIRLITWAADVFCPTARMEIAVIPDASVQVSCGSSIASLPSMSGPITVPYAFNVLTTYPYTIPQYYAFYNATSSGMITSYNFTLDAAAHITTEVDFWFYYDDLTLVLENLDAGTTTTGINRYNNNYLSAELEAGNYTLSLWFEDGQNPPIARPRKCAQFNFMFALDPLGSSVSQKCDQVGEEVPKTLDTYRFLAWGLVFDYQSNIWRIPNPEALTSVTGTYFTISQQSVFRVFVDKSAHDIDLLLSQVNVTDSNMIPVSRSSSGFDEEEIYVILDPGYYYLRFRFYNWANLKGCAYFNMEWSVQLTTPLSKLCPNSGSDFWPPAPPAVLGRDGYSYDSDTTGDYLYLQQIVDSTKSKVYSFKISQTSDFFAELDFDFSSGSLMMLLKQVNGSKYYGQRVRDGSVLVQSGLSPGDYQFTIYEETKDLPEILGCSYFSFRLLIRDSNSGNLIAQEIQYPPFPTTLDTIGQLQFNEMMHLENDYLLFTKFPFKRDVTFTLTHTSLVRATARGISDNHPIVISLSDDGGATFLTQANDTILTTADEGTYLLTFKYVGYFVFEAVTANVEIAIEPVTALQAEIQLRNPTYPSNCGKSVVKAIVLDNEGTYSYYDTDLHYPLSTISSQSIPQLIGFTLKTDSLIYAQLGYAYLLDQLSLSITNFKNSTITATNNLNIQEINTILPPGRYYLRIGVPALFKDIPNLDHCALFSLSVSIGQVSDFTTDCTDADSLPYDLNNKMRANYARVSGDNFAAPEKATTKTVSVTVRTNSYVSVYFSYNGIAENVNIGLVNSTGGAVSEVAKYSFNKPPSSRVAIFALPHNSGKLTTDWSIQLKFPSLSFIHKCPTATADFLVAPTATVADYTSCATTNQLPNKNPDFSSGLYQENIASTYPSDLLGNDYKIRIVTPLGGSLQVSAGFNSFVSSFEVVVLRINTDGSSMQVQSSSVAPSTEQGRDKNMISSLTSNLSKGNTYDIVIKTKVLATTSLPDINSDDSYCVPFSWSILIQTPQNGTVNPIISSVSPTSASQLDPQNDIVITITLSTNAYFNSKQVTKTNSNGILQSFILQNAADSPIYPNTTEGTADGLTWTLTFDSSDLTYGKNYLLKLVSGKLYDVHSVEFSLGSATYSYSTLSSNCNGHGTIGSDGNCDCYQGYAGPQCGRCAAGYENQGSKDNLVCVMKQTDKCKPASCGCAPNTPGCQPLGTCDDSSGHPVCTCITGYTGPSCNLCADGYENYPKCTPVCPDHCSTHGICNPDTLKCECLEGWAGKSCDSCAPGWKGEDCKEFAGTTDGLSFIRTAGIFFTLAVVITTIVWFAWWQIRKRSGGSTRGGNRNFFPSVDFNDGDEEDAQELDSNISGGIGLDDVLVDDEPDATEISSSSLGNGGRSANLNLDDDGFNPRTTTSSSDKPGETHLFSL